MCSTWRQRYFLEPEENRISKPFKGKVHLLAIALNYEGTESPLNCTVDTDRMIALARSSKVKDIVKMYDNGETDQFPCKADVEQEIRAMGSRCEGEDYFVMYYSGHGSTCDNEDAPEGLQSMLCLRTREGEDEEWVDDEIAALISEVLPPEVTQCSTDTGDGGILTNALLKILKRKTVADLRKKRKVSVQYVFNRAVEFADAASAEMEEASDYDDEGEEEEEEVGDNEEEDEESESDDDNIDPITGDERDEGQDINLSWPGGVQDPSRIAWPF